jgi:hypothetical protein
MKSLLLTVASLVLLTEVAAAAPGDPRVVKGTLEWPATLATESLAVVRGEDGVVYYVDASTAERLGTPITGRVSVVGVEGTRPQELSAVVIGSGDSAVATLQTPAPPEDAAASPRTDVVDDLWRVQGKVKAVNAADIVVETTHGQDVSVDASKLSSWTWQTLRPGDDVKLYGVPQADRRLVANGFIQLMPSVPSASPPSR